MPVITAGRWDPRGTKSFLGCFAVCPLSTQGTPAWPVRSRAPGALCTFALIWFNAFCSDNNHSGIKSSLCLLLSCLVRCKSTLSWSGCSNLRSVPIISLTISKIPNQAAPQAPFPRKAAQPCLPPWDAIRCHSNSSVNITEFLFMN